MPAGVLVGVLCLVGATGAVSAQSPVARPAPQTPPPHADPPLARGEVRDHRLWTPSLGVVKQYRVYLPPSYARDSTRRFPVAYYLHGLWGSEADWTTSGRLGQAMDSLVAAGMPEFVVVMPDGDDGWYTTWNTLPNVAGCRATAPAREPAETYCVSWPRYDDYIARDLVQHVDSAWRTIPDPAHRGIAGLSMGGYGAVTLAIAYPDVFAAAASHSGALTPLWRGHASADRVPPMDDVARAWGSSAWALLVPVFGRDSLGWIARDAVRRARAAWARDPARFPPIRLDVGVDDPMVSDSRRFRDALRGAGATIDYHEGPGTHDWAYWRRHVPESLRWLSERIAPR